MMNNEHIEEFPIITHNDLSVRDTRSLIFHFLYAMESFDYQESLAAIVDNFNRGFDLAIPADNEMVTTVQAIIDQRDELDLIYKPFLDNWRFERVSTAVKLILRFAVWELLQRKHDVSITINEAIELTKAFAEHDAYRFVNGILDRIAKNMVLIPVES